MEKQANSLPSYTARQQRKKAEKITYLNKCLAEFDSDEEDEDSDMLVVAATAITVSGSSSSDSLTEESASSASSSVIFGPKPKPRNIASNRRIAAVLHEEDEEDADDDDDTEEEDDWRIEHESSEFWGHWQHRRPRNQSYRFDKDDNSILDNGSVVPEDEESSTSFDDYSIESVPHSCPEDSARIVHGRKRDHHRGGSWVKQQQHGARPFVEYTADDFFADNGALDMFQELGEQCLVVQQSYSTTTHFQLLENNPAADEQRSVASSRM